MESTSDGSHGQVEDFSNCFVAAPVDFTEHNYGAMFFGQSGDGGSYLPASLVSFHLIGGADAGFDGFLAADFPDSIDRQGRFSFSPVGGGHIKGNPVQPGVERRGLLERIEFHKGLYKRILHDVHGIVATAHHVNHGIVETVLVFPDQPSERGRVAGQGLFYQSFVVVHGLKGFDAGWRWKVPAGVEGTGHNGPGGPDFPIIVFRQSAVKPLLPNHLRKGRDKSPGALVSPTLPPFESIKKVLVGWVIRVGHLDIPPLCLEG